MDKTHNECNKDTDHGSNNRNKIFLEENNLSAEENDFGGRALQGTHKWKAILNAMRLTEAPKFNKAIQNESSFKFIESMLDEFLIA